MIRLTARSIAELIGRKPKYVYVLLNRHQLRLTRDEDAPKIMDLIAKYRQKGL